MKSDLNAILPEKLNQLLCFKQTDKAMSYDSFKSFVGSQTSTLLMNSNRLPVNSVDGPQCVVGPENYDEAGEEETVDAYDEDCNFIGAVQRPPNNRFPRPRQANWLRTQPSRLVSRLGGSHGARHGLRRG